MIVEIIVSVLFIAFVAFALIGITAILLVGGEDEDE